MQIWFRMNWAIRTEIGVFQKVKGRVAEGNNVNMAPCPNLLLPFSFILALSFSSWLLYLSHIFTVLLSREVSEV